VLADIHSNIEALNKVLEYKDYDEVLILGDIVGYGANPEEAVRIVRELRPAAMIRGNHDKVVAGIDDGNTFVSHALASARWTREILRAETLQFLRDLRAGPMEVNKQITIAHGAPFDEDAYLVPQAPQPGIFDGCHTPVCFFGHTHVPTMFYGVGETTYSTQVVSPMKTSLVPENARYLINPGSVGQPRDGDARAAFLVFDTEAQNVEFYRVEYDIHAAQQKIRAAGLPDFLSQRLARGM
jgi:diadenosine tetraphosphatase ApaH/serine/threonine PP2A family protein phosphatase